MIELLEPVVQRKIKTKRPKKDSEENILQYKKQELFADYTGDLSYNEFSKVCDKFFELLTDYLLSGGMVHTPIGTFRIKTVPYKRKYLDLAKFQKEKPEKPVYRDNEDHDVLSWEPRKFAPFLKEYAFVTPFHTGRKIPQLKDLREAKRSVYVIQHHIS